MDKLKIIFVGIPDMALVCLENLLEKKFNIVGVIPPKKNHNTYNNFKNFVLTRGLNLLDFNESPNEEEYIEKIKALNADIGVVCSYNQKLSAEFLKTTKMGYINSHPSMLPNYRGAMPYFHIIRNGEKRSGITLHFMDENFDTGPIIKQIEFDILPWETMGILFNRTTYMISDALVEVLNEIQNGKEIKKIPQSKENRFIEAPRVEGNFRLRWNKSCYETECLIRACNPFYSAWTSFRGVSTKILKARSVPKEHKYELGRIVLADNENLFVACSDGLLSIELLEIGTWGLFNVNEFFCTFTPTTNEFFT